MVSVEFVRILMFLKEEEMVLISKWNKKDEVKFKEWKKTNKKNKRTNDTCVKLSFLKARFKNIFKTAFFRIRSLFF